MARRRKRRTPTYRDAIGALDELVEQHALDNFWAEPATLPPGFALPREVASFLERVPDFTWGDVRDALEVTSSDRLDLLAFGQLYSWLRSEVWGQIRARLSFDSEAEVTQPGEDFERVDLERWALGHGVSDCLDLQLRQVIGSYSYTKTLVGRLEIYTKPYATWSIADVITPNPLWKTIEAPPTKTLNGLRGFLARNIRERSVARAATERHLDTSVAPAPPAMAKLYNIVHQYAERAHRVTGARGLDLDRMTLDEDGSSLVYNEYRLSHCGGMFCSKSVSIALDPNAPGISCTCSQDAQRACPAKLEAAVMALQILRAQEPGAITSSKHDKIARTLTVPLWQRRLGGLFDLFDAASIIPEELDGQKTWFGWRIDVAKSGDPFDALKVRPAMVRHYKRGGGVVTSPVKAESVYGLIDELSDSRDRALVRMWSGIQREARTGTDWYEVIEALEGHPRVYLHDSKSRSVKIDVVPGKIEFSRATDGVELSVVFGQDVFTVEQFDTLARIFRYGPYYLDSLITGAEPSLVLWKVSHRLSQMIKYLARSKMGSLPEEAAGELLERVSALESAREFEVGEALRGEEVDHAGVTRIKLAMHHGVLHLQVASLPYEMSNSMMPGEGPRVFFAVGDDGPVHIVRDLEAERARADQVVTSLDLDHHERADHDYRFEIQEPDTALDTLAKAQFLSASADIDVRWDTQVTRAVSSSKVGGLFLMVGEQDDLFSLDGELKVDEDAIPLFVLLAAAREQRRWVQIDDERWVELTEQLQENLEQIAGVVSDSGKAEISVLAAPLLLELEQQGVTLEGPQRWLTMASDINRAAESSPALPDGVNVELREYQREGYDWLTRLAIWAPGAVLADDMGLGKTVQALVFLASRAALGPALVVGPTTLGFNWRRELEKFTPELSAVILRSSSEIKKLDEPPEAGDVVIMSYELMTRNLQWCNDQEWGTIVFDEAQALKNHTTQRSRVAAALSAGFKLCLTGTPLENHTGELWSLMRCCVPGLLGNVTGFRRRFQAPIETQNSRTARAALASLISPFVLRRVKSEVARELPERTDIRVDIELSTKERNLYDELHRAVIASVAVAEEAQSQGSRMQLLTALTRLRQLACHPRLYLPETTATSSKMEVLYERLEQLVQEGHRALVFSQFTSLLDIARDELEAQGIRCAMLSGKTRPVDRQKLVDEFQDGEYDVFLLSIKAGGVGLNLTAASFVFLLDPWWNPAVEDQATDRAHRIGQEQPVTVYRLVATNTIEEAVYKLHSTKRELFDSVLSGSGSSKSLSIDELRELLINDPMEEELEDPEEIFVEVKELLASGEGGVMLEVEEVDERERLSPQDLDELIETYLDEQIEDGEMSRATAKSYTPALKRMGRWILARDDWPSGEFVAASMPEYLEEMAAGSAQAPARDQRIWKVVSRHLAGALDG